MWVSILVLVATRLNIIGATTMSSEAHLFVNGVDSDGGASLLACSIDH